MLWIIWYMQILELADHRFDVLYLIKDHGFEQNYIGGTVKSCYSILKQYALTILWYHEITCFYANLLSFYIFCS